MSGRVASPLRAQPRSPDGRPRNETRSARDTCEGTRDLRSWLSSRSHRRRPPYNELDSNDDRHKDRVQVQYPLQHRASRKRLWHRRTSSRSPEQSQGHSDRGGSPKSRRIDVRAPHQSSKRRPENTQKPVMTARRTPITQRRDASTCGPTLRNVNCVLHLRARHVLSQCKVFKGLSYHKRLQRLKILNACLRCGGLHDTEECRRPVLCKACRERHLTLLHPPALQPENKEELPTLAIEGSIEVSRITDAHLEKQIVLWKDPSKPSQNLDEEAVKTLLSRVHGSVREVTDVIKTISLSHEDDTDDQAQIQKAALYGAFIYAAECISSYRRHLKTCGLDTMAHWYGEYLQSLRYECEQKQILLRADTATSPTHKGSRWTRIRPRTTKVGGGSVSKSRV